MKHKKSALGTFNYCRGRRRAKGSLLRDVLINLLRRRGSYKFESADENVKLPGLYFAFSIDYPPKNRRFTEAVIEGFSRPRRVTRS